MTTAERAIVRRFRLLKLGPILTIVPYRLRRYDAVEQACWGEFSVGPELCNAFGNIHGGIITTMLDICATTTAMCAQALRGGAPTIELKTSFLAPVPAGRVRSEGRVLRMGRSIAFLEGRLYGPRNDLLAVGSLTTRPTPFPDHVIAGLG